MRAHSMFFYLLSIGFVGSILFFPVMWIAGGAAPDRLEYKDLVTIQLTALAVLLAALGIGVAALAIWGYKEFMNRAEISANAAAVKATNTHLESDEFKVRLRMVVDDLQKERSTAIVGTISTTAPAAVVNIVGEVSDAPKPLPEPPKRGRKPRAGAGPSDGGKDN